MRDMAGWHNTLPMLAALPLCRPTPAPRFPGSRFPGPRPQVPRFPGHPQGVALLYTAPPLLRRVVARSHGGRAGSRIVGPPLAGGLRRRGRRAAGLAGSVVEGNILYRMTSSLTLA